MKIFKSSLIVNIEVPNEGFMKMQCTVDMEISDTS